MGSYRLREKYKQMSPLQPLLDLTLLKSLSASLHGKSHSLHRSNLVFKGGLRCVTTALGESAVSFKMRLRGVKEGIFRSR